jgi:hypothetical protein
MKNSFILPSSCSLLCIISATAIEGIKCVEGLWVFTPLGWTQSSTFLLIQFWYKNFLNFLSLPDIVIIICETCKHGMLNIDEWLVDYNTVSTAHVIYDEVKWKDDYAWWKERAIGCDHGLV